MAEGLTTDDGTLIQDVAPVGNENDFAALQADLASQADTTPKEPTQAPAPPKKDPTEKPARRPRAKRGDKTNAPRVQSPKGSQTKKDYTQDLTGLVQTLWGATAVFAPADAGAIQMHGPGMVKAWNDLAKENAQVAKGIEWLTTGSAYGAVVMTTAPLVMQLLVNHGVLPGERLAPIGVQDPEALANLAVQTAQGMAEQGAQ